LRPIFSDEMTTILHRAWISTCLWSIQ